VFLCHYQGEKVSTLEGGIATGLTETPVRGRESAPAGKRLTLKEKRNSASLPFFEKLRWGHCAYFEGLSTRLKRGGTKGKTRSSNGNGSSRHPGRSTLPRASRRGEKIRSERGFYPLHLLPVIRVMGGKRCTARCGSGRFSHKGRRCTAEKRRPGAASRS